MSSISGAMFPPLGFLGACACFYLGARGFQRRGIVLWYRTGGSSRIHGLAGRIAGTILILFGCVLLGTSIREVMLQ